MAAAARQDPDPDAPDAVDVSVETGPVTALADELEPDPESERARPPTRDDDAREAELERAHRDRDVPRHRSLVLEWMRQWLRRQERPAVEPLPEVAGNQVSITYAGHACTLIRYRNLSIVTDPMLGNWVGGIKRQIAPGLSPAELQDVNLILLSHAHRDHLHRATLAQLPRSATVVVPPRTAHRISDLGFARVVELGVGQSLQHRRVDVATTAVRHTGRGAERPVAYVIRGDGPSVFFCGDSAYFSGFADVGRRYRPDVALLPISGYWPRAFRREHMSPLDALHAFEDLQARIMVPIHHGVFTLSYELRHDPSRWLAELVRERDLDRHVVALEPGSSRVFAPPGDAPL